MKSPDAWRGALQANSAEHVPKSPLYAVRIPWRINGSLITQLGPLITARSVAMKTLY